MNEIGILGLDTTHSDEFARLLESGERATVSAVWDGGDVHDTEYCAQFCARHDAVKYDQPADMLGEVDGVVVTTVNWETHRTLAEPFLRAGTPVLIDKPVAGSLQDIEALVDAAEAGGVTLFGGSAVPYHPRVTEIETVETERTVFGVGYNDPFYYGPHLVDTIARILAVDWTRIERNDAPGASVNIMFADGSVATLQFDGSAEAGTFEFLLTDRRYTNSVSIESNEAELERMYRSFLGRFLDFIETGQGNQTRLVEAATMLLGVGASLETGERIRPDSDALANYTADGAAFLAQYR